MKSKFPKLALAMSVLLLFAMLGGPEMLMAQASPQQPAQSQAATSQEQIAMLPEAPSPQQAVGTPALPQDAQPDAQQQQQNTTQNQNNAPKQKEQNPVGAAAAQKGPTAGGAASKPAGNAIAPAKQRQVRSFLLKLGLIAAGGAAIGTVYALSRGTASTPPGAGR